MNHTENLHGIKLDVQTVDMIIGEKLQQEILDIITRLRRHIAEVIGSTFILLKKVGRLRMHEQ